MNPIRVTIWNEGWHERHTPEALKIYPDGIGEALAAPLRKEGNLQVRTVCCFDPDNGLPDDVLDNTDVLVWWSHMIHGEVPDERVEKVVRRVWEGMGFMPLHSSHLCKPFTRLMGTECMLRWRDKGEKEILWVTEPSHPIVQGIGDKIELAKTEMYGEWFQIPTPDEVIFISSFEGGEVFRSGCTWKRGKGRVFYFRPGHELFPIYHEEAIQRVIRNGVHWTANRPAIP